MGCSHVRALSIDLSDEDATHLSVDPAEAMGFDLFLHATGEVDSHAHDASLWTIS